MIGISTLSLTKQQFYYDKSQVLFQIFFIFFQSPPSLSFDVQEAGLKCPADGGFPFSFLFPWIWIFSFLIAHIINNNVSKGQRDKGTKGQRDNERMGEWENLRQWRQWRQWTMVLPGNDFYDSIPLWMNAKYF